MKTLSLAFLVAGLSSTSTTMAMGTEILQSAPEPGSYALVLAVIGMLGVILRRS